MLNENDFKDFLQAMLEEIEVRNKRDHWKLMERKYLPPRAKTIMAIWSFKQKLYPDCSLNKHISILCAHGGKQTWGRDYWDTYAPVVTWDSVCLLLVVEKFTISIPRVSFFTGISTIRSSNPCLHGTSCRSNSN